MTVSPPMWISDSGNLEALYLTIRKWSYKCSAVYHKRTKHHCRIFDARRISYRAVNIRQHLDRISLNNTHHSRIVCQSLFVTRGDQTTCIIEYVQINILVHTSTKTTIQRIIHVTGTIEIMWCHEITAKQVYVQTKAVLEQVLLRSIYIRQRFFKLRRERKSVRVYLILIGIQCLKSSVQLTVVNPVLKAKADTAAYFRILFSFISNTCKI